jgi:hypothetical protein
MELKIIQPSSDQQKPQESKRHREDGMQEPHSIDAVRKLAQRMKALTAT